MKRRVVLLLTAMAAALLLASGTALAFSEITCTGVNPCNGNNDSNAIHGTDGRDIIYAKAGTIDWIDANAGSDEVYGGKGQDAIQGGNGSDLLSGGPGADSIDALDYPSSPSGTPGTDTVKGGGGNDQINANDGVEDLIDCGKGKDDQVYYDAGLDTIRNCEIRFPR